MAASSHVLEGQSSLRDTLQHLAALEGRTHAGLESLFGACRVPVPSEWSITGLLGSLLWYKPAWAPPIPVETGSTAASHPP